MKRFVFCLNLMICMELIFGTVPGFKNFNVAFAQEQTCPSGLVMDSTLNRCITSDQQASLINATASCNGDKECYKRLAEEELKKGEEEGSIAKSVANKGGLIGAAGKIAAIAGPLTVILGAFRNKKCMNASGIAMIAGGVSFTVGDFMANRKHKSCLKKIKKDWETKKAASTETTSSGTTKVSSSEGQSEAFEMLAKSEECMQSSAKMKAGFYAASTLAFGASAVLATIEAMKPDAGGSCTRAPKPDLPLDDAAAFVQDRKLDSQIAYNIHQAQDLSAVLVNSSLLNKKKLTCASIEEYQDFKKAFDGMDVDHDHSVIATFKEVYAGLKSELSILKPAHAFQIPPVNPAPTVAVPAIAPAASAPAAAVGAEVMGEEIVVMGKRYDFIDNMNTPMARAIISGVLAGMSALMWMHANKQARVAKSRAEFLRGLKKEFNDANGVNSCTEQERNTSANANCYCYTEGGQRNQARTNSQVCQQLFTGQTLAKAGDYSSLDFSNQRVCISASGNPDENCSCKATKSCLSGLPGTVGNLGLGAISIASNGTKSVNDLSSGNIGAGSVNGAAALSGAVRMLDKKKELEAKLKVDPAKQKKIAADFEKGIMTAAAGMPNRGGGSSSGLPFNMSSSQAAAALEKELQKSGSDFEQASGSPALAQPGNSAVEDAGFVIDSPTAAESTDAQVAEVMATELDYGQSDITQSNTNIFEIVSNRYQRSGMKRLFEEPVKAEAEKK